MNIPSSFTISSPCQNRENTQATGSRNAIWRNQPIQNIAANGLKLVKSALLVFVLEALQHGCVYAQKGHFIYYHLP